MLFRSQMAMMHKNDPYTLPLIIAEDGRRKELRQAAQMAQAQPQAKVVDQDIAAMGPLPEQQGIGMLPAPNMARMADGGIAGMPDGSDASLQYDNEPVLRMADGGVARYAGNNVGPYGQVTGAQDARNPLAFLNPSDLVDALGNYFNRQQVEAAQRRAR